MNYLRKNIYRGFEIDKNNLGCDVQLKNDSLYKAKRIPRGWEISDEEIHGLARSFMEHRMSVEAQAKTEKTKFMAMG